MLSLALAAAIAAAPTDAELGSKSEPKHVQAMQGYARCVVMEWPSEVRALLAMDYRDNAYGKTMTRLANKPAPCPGIDVPRGAYASGTLLWGGALAEGLLVREKMLDRLGEATAYRPELPAIEARNPGELMAFCIVRTKADQVAGLLETEPATKAELEAIRAMGATLSGCVPANSKSEFTREALRALLALGAYRLAAHNRSPAGTAQEAAE